MNKTYRNRMVNKGIALHKNLTAFLRQNMGDDWNYYRYGYLKLADRSIKIDFNRNSQNVEYFNYKMVPECEHSVGEAFSLIPNYKDGFLVRIVFDKDDTHHSKLLACKVPHPFETKLTLEQMKEFEDFIDELDKDLPTLVYDTQKTHQADNLYDDWQASRNQSIYKEEVENLPKEETTLEVVKTAVDWWINKITGSTFSGNIEIPGFAGFYANLALRERYSEHTPEAHEVEVFRLLLTNAITEKLSEGLEIRLTTDYSPEGILSELMDQAHISSARAPIKTSMFVTIDRICVNGEDIYSKEYEIDKYLHHEKPASLTRTQE